jgi:hypothetical protein
MADTFDANPTTLPPLTRAISESYGKPSNFGGRPLDPVAVPASFRATLDAIHQLETRVIALEAGATP